MVIVQDSFGGGACQGDSVAGDSVAFPCHFHGACLFSPSLCWLLQNGACDAERVGGAKEHRSARISFWIVPAVSFSASGSGVHRIPEWAEIAVKDDVNFRLL